MSPMSKPAFFRMHWLLLVILALISACIPNSPMPALGGASEPFDGLWTAGFMREMNTGSEQKSTPWHTFVLDLQQEGEDVSGTLRAEGPDVSGVVHGMVDEKGVFHGTMRLSWDDHDWESLTLSFLPDGASGTGTAIFKAAPDEFHLSSIQLHSGPEYGGSVTPPFAPAESPTPEGRVVIRLLVDSFAEPALVAGVEAYNASQDDIQLELMIEQFEYDWLTTQLAQRAENGGGDLPDLIGPYSADFLHRFPDPWLDLSPYLDGDELAAFDPNALRGWQNADGQLLGLPAWLYPTVIFYNRDLFDAAGLPYPPQRPGEPYADGEAWTIEKMESIAIQLTLDGYGRTPASPDFDAADVKQYGLSHMSDCAGEITALFGNPQPSIAADGKILLTDPWKEAIRWYYSAMWEKHFMAHGGVMGRWTAFDSGQAAMVYAPTWYLASIKTLQTWDLAPVPAHNGLITSHTDTLGVAALSTTRHPREAAQVLRYLASTPELYRPEDFRSGIALPARLDFQPPYLAELDARYQQGVNWGVAIDSLPYSQYADYNIDNNPLCQRELMDRLSTIPGLDLEDQFHRAIFGR